MADLIITAANVLTGAGAPAEIEQRPMGATLMAGKAVYKDDSDGGKLKLADCNDAAAAVRTLHGIMLNGGAAAQPGTVQRGGIINLGAALTVGKTYVLSATAGGICPIDDLATGHYVVIVGVAISASLLKMGIINSGAQVP